MISDRLENFDSSAIRSAIKQADQQKNIIDLSVGYPEEDTPAHIKLAGKYAIEEGYTKYTPANGLYDLRMAAAEKLGEENHISANAATVAVVPGLTTGILISYLAILDPGDQIIIADPHFPPYKSLAEMLGVDVATIETQPTFQLKAEGVEEAITKNTKAIFINSPNNPTGAVYPESELRKVVEIARDNGIVLISDEIYEHFTYESHHFSVGSIYKNTLTLNGFSKAYAMTGWRIGYIHGPKNIIEAINELLQYAVFSSSSISQHAALAALEDKPNVAAKYQKKRDMVQNKMKNTVNLTGLDGAYYAFIKTPAGINDLEFCEQALEAGVLVLPGRAFSASKQYFRISYGGSIEELETGLGILVKLLE